MSKDTFSYLAWFLGPKAENGRFFERLLVDTFRDYAHWRKNYFPGDPILITQQLRNAQEEDRSVLETRHSELLAKLRRNFPFYSPRYIAHELSDVSMPAMLGYFAGMLYNPNNVTPEAAPVTTELEVEVTAEILQMLGYQPPLPLPGPGVDPVAYYTAKGQRKEFGWAHLTSGGTVANIEALWVARQVRYFPLSVRDLARKLNLDITVKLANDEAMPIKECDPYELLCMRPNEAIYLLPRLVGELRRFGHITSDENALQDTWDLLGESPFAINRGFGQAFAQYRPVVLVASSRHYSVAKAANLLGIGQASIIPIKMDERFRLDVGHLRQVLIEQVHANKLVPLGVIATAGTTEEGAVDPIHSVNDLRTELESSHKLSFWLHIDAAWGGYLRSLLKLDEYDRVEAVCSQAARFLGLRAPAISAQREPAELMRWHAQLVEKVEKQAEARRTGTHPFGRSKPKLEKDLQSLASMLQQDRYDDYAKGLRKVLELLRDPEDQNAPINEWLDRVRGDGLDAGAIMSWLRAYVAGDLEVDTGGAVKQVGINWPSDDVGHALLAMPRAESITIDPHKMGYAPYPAGCAAFRNDLVRSFILQKAPYITSVKQTGMVHVPPRHKTPDGDTVMESFSPFILEGSRPGAVAAGLWLAMKCAPYTPRGHGAIARASLLAARSLHEKIKAWDHQKRFKFVTLSDQHLDTNLVTFTVVPTTYDDLASMNRMSALVYQTFSILAELGDREHSYSQPFFLSKTTMQQEEYPFTMLHNFFDRCGLKTTAKEYKGAGVTVLRATVMNPYILPARYLVDQDFCSQFMESLISAGEEAFQEVVQLAAKRKRKKTQGG